MRSWLKSTVILIAGAILLPTSGLSDNTLVHIRLSQEEQNRLGGTQDRIARVVSPVSASGAVQVTILTKVGPVTLVRRKSETSAEVRKLDILENGDLVTFSQDGIPYEGSVQNVFANNKVRIHFKASLEDNTPLEIWRNADELIAHPRCVKMVCTGDLVEIQGFFRSSKGAILDLEQRPLAPKPTAILDQDGKLRRVSVRRLKPLNEPLASERLWRSADGYYVKRPF